MSQLPYFPLYPTDFEADVAPHALRKMGLQPPSAPDVDDARAACPMMMRGSCGGCVATLKRSGRVVLPVIGVLHAGWPGFFAASHHVSAGGRIFDNTKRVKRQKGGRKPKQLENNETEESWLRPGLSNQNQNQI